MTTLEIGNPSNSRKQQFIIDQELDSIMRENQNYLKRCAESEMMDAIMKGEYEPIFAKEVKSDTYIYVMYDENTKQYKIGRSKHPEYRERTLQSEKPSIVMQFYYSGVNADEKYLHEKFKNKRTRGEWFKLNFSDLNEIERYFLEKKL